MLSSHLSHRRADLTGNFARPVRLAPRGPAGSEKGVVTCKRSTSTSW